MTLCYQDAKRKAELYKLLYKEIFGYDNVEICLNFTRDEMIAKLNELDTEAQSFGKNHAEKTSLAIDVVNVGFKLCLQHHKTIIKKLRPPQITC